MKHYLTLGESFKKLNLHSYGSDEFLVGRTGYLFGALWLNKQLQKEAIPISFMHTLCQVVTESGKNYARMQKSACPLMYAYYDTEYLGAAHGLASILQILIQVNNIF